MVGLRKVVAESILAFMGRFFFIEAKTFEFIIEPWGNAIWLRIVERGKGLFMLNRFGERGSCVASLDAR